MNVLMISPAYPGEMPRFTRALAAQGARVFGLGDQPGSSLPAEVRQALVAHLQVSDLWDEHAVVRRVLHEASEAGTRFDRVECLWEPAMFLAARLREALGAPGLNLEQTIPFRDKERMKQVLDAAGIRTPWHRRARTADECRAAAAECGFPVIVKPIAGAGSADTHRVDDRQQLEQILPTLRHVDEVSVEEFVEGDEFTFDAICAGGEIVFENIAFYRPRPIEEKTAWWISPSSMGHAVLQALGYQNGFSHMEWYRRANGEVVFGEIGARPPGARLVSAMNFACDVDLHAGWAEAVCHRRFTQPVQRRYNATILCKRAQGQGRIQRVEGLDRLLADLGSSIAAGSALSDGWVIVRHPELQTTFEIADRVARELQIYAG